MSLEKTRNQVKTAYMWASGAGFFLSLLIFNESAPQGILFSLLVPMVFYIVYGYQVASDYQYMPEFADSVYYLGFSFTLISLLMATLSEQFEDPEKTIRFFGMALSTTITGLLFRNYHSQFIDLNEDPINKAKKELEVEVNSFKDTSSQLSTMMTEIVNNYELLNSKLINDLPAHFESNQKSFSNQMKLSNESFIENINRIDSQLSRISGSLEYQVSSISSKLNNNVDNISTEYVNIGKTFELLNNKLEKETNNIFSNFEKTSKYSDQLSNLIDKKIKDLNTGLESLNIDKIQKKLHTSEEHFADYNSRIKQTKTSFIKTMKDMEKFSKTIGYEIENIHKIFRDMEKILTKDLK